VGGQPEARRQFARPEEALLIGEREQDVPGAAGTRCGGVLRRGAGCAPQACSGGGGAGQLEEITARRMVVVIAFR
jgi:hypothetical protein